MTPLDYYNEQCQKGFIIDDPHQHEALQKLQSIYFQLTEENKKRSGVFSFLHPRQQIQGLYLWGGVGIGKTFLMDCFYQTLPIQKKLRMHFFAFMRRIHLELTSHQGKQDPLTLIAKEIAKETDVLCFDELFVSDITDAMILGRLFKILFENNVCLVATSNVMPDDLYKNGLQREQFLPAIALIKRYLQIIHIRTTVDYRLRHLKEAGVFYTPLDETAEKNMEKSFNELTRGLSVDDAPIAIQGRTIPVKKKAGKIIWFEFEDICSVPRSQVDYLAIAEHYRTVFISHIPAIPSHAKDIICLFISLVDVLYDARVRLVISAAEPIQNLYNRGFMIMEYTRTHSRLIEMQSADYFADEESNKQRGILE